MSTKKQQEEAKYRDRIEYFSNVITFLSNFSGINIERLSETKYRLHFAKYYYELSLIWTLKQDQRI